MDKNNNANKIEKIRRTMEAGEYAKAMELAGQVDSSRLKSAADLSVLAEAHYKNNDYRTALLYFEQIYQKTRTRRILINLINLCLKLSMADMAETYLKDFIEMAPKDFYRHIFRYRIDKLRGESLDVLIFDLELLREDNYMEDWAYELAKLYHKSGQPEKCIAECNDIILWFGSGTYVERAKGLRAIHLAEQETGGLEEQEVELVQEVRRLVGVGRSSEEVENFIEESTTPEGRVPHFSEEEYRSERFGEPVYEEEGKEVIWNTREFGPITDEMIQQQNTMDALRGMQVAEQIKLKLNQDKEVYVEPALNEQSEQQESSAVISEAKEDTAAVQMAELPSGSSKPEEKAIEPKEQAWAAESTQEADVQEEETERVVRPVRKSIWEKRREERARKRQSAEEKKKALEEEKASQEAARLEREAEEKLYRLLQEEEQEAELSKAVRSLGEETESKEDEKFQTKPFVPVAATAEEVEPLAAETEKTEGLEALPAEQEVQETATEESPAEELETAPEEETLEEATSEESEIYDYPEELKLAAAPEPGSELAALLDQKGKQLKDFFAEFLPFAEVRKQLLRSLEQLAGGKSNPAALILSGEEKSGKTTLAKAIAKCMQTLGLQTSPKVALICGDKLNRISLAERKEQLQGATLIIERASELSQERTAELVAIMPEFAGSTTVILEDKRSDINQLLRNNMELNGIFNNRIHLPKWSDEDYFLMALVMFAQKEYLLTKTAAEIYLGEVGKLLSTHREDRCAAIREYAEKVMFRAEQRMADQLRQLALEGRYQEANLQLIIEEDLIF